MHLRVLAQSSSDPSEKKHASKVLKLLQRGRHWVLVVLLLGNVVSTQVDAGFSIFCPACSSLDFDFDGTTIWLVGANVRCEDVQIVNESLPIFLDSVLGGGIAAVLVSTVS